MSNQYAVAGKAESSEAYFRYIIESWSLLDDDITGMKLHVGKQLIQITTDVGNSDNLFVAHIFLIALCIPSCVTVRPTRVLSGCQPGPEQRLQGKRSGDGAKKHYDIHTFSLQIHQCVR